MPTHPLTGPATALALASALLVPGAAAGATRRPDVPFTCDPTTSLVLVGMDTREGRLVWRAAGGPSGSRGWAVEAAPSTASGTGAGGSWTELARYHPLPDGPLPYGGSIGPGPVFAVVDCGPSCLQPVRWDAGAWQAFGDRVTAPEASTVHTTWDLHGRPWIVLQASGPAERKVTAWAFRLEGRDWVAAGSQTVIASGSSEAVPDPLVEDAVRSGTGRFASAAPPAAWLTALPRLGPERGGVLVPVLGGAAYLTDDGSLFLSDDGATWVRTRWTPWGRQPTRIWTPGHDYTLDLPAADHRGPLGVVWIDRRRSDRERLLLTEWSPQGDWRLLSELAADITTLNGDSLPYTDFFVLRPSEWLLLSGCAHTANGPGLVLRTYGPGGLSPARFLPLRPGGTVEPLAPAEE